MSKMIDLNYWVVLTKPLEKMTERISNLPIYDFSVGIEKCFAEKVTLPIFMKKKVAKSNGCVFDADYVLSVFRSTYMRCSKGIHKIYVMNDKKEIYKITLVSYAQARIASNDFSELLMEMSFDYARAYAMYLKNNEYVLQALNNPQIKFPESFQKLADSETKKTSFDGIIRSFSTSGGMSQQEIENKKFAQRMLFTMEKTERQKVSEEWKNGIVIDVIGKPTERKG